MIDKKSNSQISKFLSLVLRHTPEKIGLKLDDAGWANTDELIARMNKAGHNIDLDILEHVVETNQKKRFAFSEDKRLIRANQGHSIQVDHGYESCIPPSILFHGSAVKNQESILKIGLDKRQRHHVHLSADVKTAIAVGKRHGQPVVF